MTIIAAMRDVDGTILIGADSQMTDPTSFLRYTIDKLKRHSSGQLVWGTAGAACLGDTFSEWMQSYPWPPADWQSLISIIKEKVVEINGYQRRLIKRAEGEPGPGDGFDVLVVGCLDSLDAPRMVVIDDCGRDSTTPEQDFNAIGGSAQAKYILVGVDCTLSFLQAVAGIPPPDRFLKMQLIFSAAATKIEGCGLPIHIWRVSKDGIEKLLPSEESDNQDSITVVIPGAPKAT